MTALVLAAAIVVVLAPAAFGAPETLSQQQDDVGQPGLVGLSATRLDFGEIEEGASATLPLTVTNVGEAALVVERAAVVQGTEAFAVAEDGCARRTLERNATCTLAVAFRPAGEGEHGGVLDLASSDPRGSHRVELAGTGVARRPGEPALQLGRERMDFGTVAADEEASLDLTATSTGEGPLTIERVVIDGAAAAFDVTGDGCTDRTLPPGEACTLTVTYRPAEEGEHTAILAVVSDDPEGPHRVVLAGTGLREDPSLPVLRLSRDRIDFGAVALDTTSVRELALANAGDAPLAIEAVDIGGADDYRIAADDCSGRMLPPGEACDLEIAFRPAVEDSREAVLDVRSNAPGGPHRAELVGVGLATVELVPVPDVEGLTLDGAEQAVGAAGLSLAPGGEGRASGEATVARQEPAPGTLVPAGTAVAVELDGDLGRLPLAAALLAALAAVGTVRALRRRSRRWVRKHVRLEPRSDPLAPGVEDVDPRPSRAVRLVPRGDRGSLTVEEVRS